MASSSAGFGSKGAGIDGILGRVLELSLIYCLILPADFRHSRIGPTGLTAGTVFGQTVIDNLYSQKTIAKDTMGIYYAPASANSSTGTLDFGDSATWVSARIICRF